MICEVKGKTIDLPPGFALFEENGKCVLHHTTEDIVKIYPEDALVEDTKKIVFQDIDSFLKRLSGRGQRILTPALFYFGRLSLLTRE